MSEKYFYNKFFNCLIEIHDQVQTEQWAASVLPNGKRPTDGWSCKDYMNFFVSIYIKYISLLKRVEDCYDQIIHPQIRKVLKVFVENLACRLVKVKQELLFFNNPIVEAVPSIHYVFLDDYLIDLKLEYTALDVPIPRYFNEDELLVDRRILLEETIKELNDGKLLPQTDVTKFFFNCELNFDSAVRIIQNFELGRQSLKKISKALKLANKKIDSNEMVRDKEILMGDDKKKLIMEHLIATQNIKKTREQELKFLKMIPDDNSSIVNAVSIESEVSTMISNVPTPSENRVNRKKIQKEKEIEYKAFKKDLETNIKLVEGYDMKQNMINERRDWLEKYKQNHKGEPPESLKPFYEKDDVSRRVELDENQKKKQDQINKEKLKKEQDKKKKDEQGDKIKLNPYTGPKGKEMENIQNAIGNFKMNFERTSSFMKEEFLQEIAKSEIMDGIKAAIQKEVDDMIEIEIKNRRTIFLRGKRDRVPRPARVKPVPEKLGLGEKGIVKIPVTELFKVLVEKNVIRNMIPRHLEELQCDFNYIAHSMQIVDEQLLEVPLFYTKQLIKEFCIFPLGSQLIKSNMGTNVTSVLFHGPPGTGKTHAAIAVAQHADAIFIDLSPRNLEGKLNSKEEASRLLASAFRVAKNFQPAVIYFDNAEQIFVNTKVKGVVKNPHAQKLRRFLLSFKNLITQDMRVLFIGCTNKGWHMNQKEMKAMFDKTMYFTLPSFSDRFKLWTSEITKRVGRVYDLEYDVLAEMSNGFSAESIIQAIDYTLSKHRLERVKFNSIQTEEFITALSKTQYVYKEDFALNRQFLYFASGLEDIHKYLQQKREENEKNTKKNR